MTFDNSHRNRPDRLDGSDLRIPCHRLPGTAAAALMAIAVTACTSAADDDALIVIEKQGSFAVGGAVLGDPDVSSLHCDHGFVDYQEFDSVENARLQATAAAVLADSIGPTVALTNSAGGLRALLRRSRVTTIPLQIVWGDNVDKSDRLARRSSNPRSSSS